MSENRDSIDAKRVFPPLNDSHPGDFCWDFDDESLGGKRTDETHWLYIHLPGEQHRGAIQVRRGAPGGNRVWGWDGNEDKPTLQPSIHHVGVWHGHLVAGRLVSC